MKKPIGPLMIAWGVSTAYAADKWLAGAVKNSFANKGMVPAK